MVDPHVAGFLARIYLGGTNNNIVTYLNDTFPRTPAAGSQACHVVWHHVAFT